MNRLTILFIGTLLTTSCDSNVVLSERESSVLTIGSRGRQPGQFSKPRAVGITAAGEIVVIDRTGRIQMLSIRDGAFVRQWRLREISLGTPTGLSIDPGDDSIWVADTHYNRVLQFDREGNLLFQFGEEGIEPGKFRFITDVYPDPDGKTLWITDFGTRNRVMQFHRDGRFIKEWGPEPYHDNHDLERPMSLVVSHNGERIYVVDTGNSRINCYDREGRLVMTFGGLGNEPGQLRYPQDIALAADGSLYVVEYGNARVSRFDSDGNFLGIWGAVGRGPGEFFAPWGIAIGPAGEIVVADTSNDRLQLFKSPETLLQLTQVPSINAE